MWLELLSSLNVVFSVASLATSWFKYFQFKMMNAVADAVHATEQRVRTELSNTVSPLRMRAISPEPGAGAIDRL